MMLKNALAVVVLSLIAFGCAADTSEADSTVQSLTPVPGIAPPNCVGPYWVEICSTTTPDPDETEWMRQLVVLNPTGQVAVSGGNASCTSTTNTALVMPTSERPPGIACWKRCFDL